VASAGQVYEFYWEDREASEGATKEKYCYVFSYGSMTSLFVFEMTLIQILHECADFLYSLR
jgi:nitrate reductase assembly molybdenum cofactor insertion protein NarJ